MMVMWRGQCLLCTRITEEIKDDLIKTIFR
jgi:hypothetical protein